MKRKTAKILNTFVLFMTVVFLFTACSFGASLTLRAPVLIHESKDKTISWSQNDKATKFDVYVNNEVVESVAQDISKSVYVFNYSQHILEDGSYKIKVKAIGDGEKYKDSRFSNTVVVYIGENNVGGYDTVSLSIVRNSSWAPSNIEYAFEGNTISWDVCEKNGNIPEKYVVQIYCNNYTDATDNTDKIRSFYVTQNYFVLDEYLKGNEVLAISVGSKYSQDDNIYVANVFYM